MSTATNDEIKLSLTEILTKQYTSTITFLFDNEAPPSPSSSIAMQTKDSMQTNEKTVSNDIKSLNCTKLSLQVVKALLTSSSTTSSSNIDDSAIGHANDQQLSTNDFQVSIKLSGNHLILLDVSYNLATAIGQGTAIEQPSSIQSIGHLLHVIFTSDTNKQQLIQQKSSVVSEDTTSSDDNIKSGVSGGGKDLRIAKVRRSQIDTLFATLGKFKQ